MSFATPINITGNTTNTITNFVRAGVVQISGTFGGGTLTVNVSTDGGTTWTTPTNGTFTAAAVFNFNCANRVLVQFVMSGATSPNVNVFFNAS